MHAVFSSSHTLSYIHPHTHTHIDSSLKQLLSPEEAQEVTTARVRYELMETFEEVFPSMELCVTECKALPGGVEEVVCVGEEEEGEGEPELARGV